MKRIKLVICSALIVAFGVFLLPGTAQSDEVEPYTHSTSVIEYTRNDLGVLTGQTARSVSDGVNLEGQTVHSESTVDFTIISGQAYAHTMDSTTRTESTNGAWSERIEHVEYLRDENGRFIDTGAIGTRTVTSYDGVNRTSYQEGDLTFQIINGEPQIAKWDFEQAVWNGEKTDAYIPTTVENELVSYAKGTTEYNYFIFHGVAKVTDVETIGTSWTFTNGTLPERQGENEIEIVPCPLAPNKNYPFTVYDNKTHYAYDEYGNLKPTSSDIQVVNETDSEGNVIAQKLLINGQEVSFTQLQEYLAGSDNDFSYSISSSAGVQSSGNGWAVFAQNEFTSLGLYNGVLQPDWTYRESDSTPIQSSTTTYIDPEVNGTILGRVYLPGSSTLIDNDEYLKEDMETLWLFVKDTKDTIWALKFEGNGSLLNQAKALSVGDSININGSTLSGHDEHSTILQVTEIIEIIRNNNTQ